MNQQHEDLQASAPTYHSIGEVARDTGVNAVTLRAWERRHGLLQPTRTDTGHRLYSQADIDTVQSILGWLERGVPVSRVARILARGTAAAQVQAAAETAQAPRWWQARAREALADFDDQRLAQLHEQAVAAVGLDAVFEQVWMPLWTSLHGASALYGQVSERLFLDQFLCHLVSGLLRGPGATCAAQVLLAPLNEDVRMLELLVAGLLLSSAEMSVTVLPVGQPLAELALICERRAADALVLVSHHHPPAELGRRLAQVARGLGCPLALAGEMADLADTLLAGSPVACLGAQAVGMRLRLQRFLAGQLDT